MKQKYPTKAERAEYEAKEKICPVCAKRFYGNWAKWVLSPYCSKECARSFSSTVKKDEKNKKIRDSVKRYYDNNEERKIKLEEKRKAIIQNNLCPICGKELTWRQIESGNKTCSLACGSQMANKTKEENGTVFVENGQGRSRSGYWKGFFCNSTYELVYYIYMSEHGYKIERNTKAYEYEWKGSKRLYYPDFILNDNLVEIKGYWTPQVQAKIDAVTDKELSVLYYEDLEPMMDWIDSKYNTKHWKKDNNYWELYDNSKPIYRYKYICDVCGKEFETNTYRKPGKWKHVVCSLECRTKSKKFNESPLV